MKQIIASLATASCLLLVAAGTAFAAPQGPGGTPTSPDHRAQRRTNQYMRLNCHRNSSRQFGLGERITVQPQWAGG
jgi:hypothetical protein